MLSLNVTTETHDHLKNYFKLKSSCKDVIFCFCENAFKVMLFKLTTVSSATGLHFDFGLLLISVIVIKGFWKTVLSMNIVLKYDAKIQFTIINKRYILSATRNHDVGPE